MSHEPQHRGAHPQDAVIFAPAAIEVMREGVRDCAYLLDRGYSTDSALDVVGRRYALRARQRLALQRAICATEQKRKRESTQRELPQIGDAQLWVDGFNLVIGLEVALSGGVLLRCRDGAIRDLAGLRGTYRMVTETDLALSLLRDVLCDFRPRALHVLLDSPVSNSGRLRAKILEHAADWPFAVEVGLVANPDRDLRGRDWVVSSDSLVLDAAASWLNLLGYIVRQRLTQAWCVDLADQ